jgi:soluble lytic murein transglycosylase
MQVPVYQRQAQQQGLPNARQTTQVDASNFLSGTEAAALKYGEQSAGDINQAVQQHYTEQLKEANQARIMDVSTQLQTHVQDAMYGKSGALSKMGADAFLGSDGRSAMDMVFDDTLKKQNALADTLGDDTQKADFKQQTNSMLMSMRGQLMGHESQQHRVYVQSTLEASNAAQSNNIALNYNDHAGIQKSIDQIQANSDQLGKLHGYGPEWGTVNAQTSVSGALNKVIDAATDRGDHKTALDMMQGFAGKMNQNDLITNYSKISKAQGEANAINYATTAMNTLKSGFTPQDGDRLNSLVLGIESSGGRHFRADGKPTISPDGAIGKWQVMPKTGPEAASLAGLSWDEKLFNQVRSGNPEIDNKAEQYNDALGKAYLQKQLQTNHGDLPKALAAYNAGPGALQKAVNKADKDGGNWLSYLPAETQNYVNTITTQYNQGGGKPPEPTLQDAQDLALSLNPHATIAERNTTIQEVTRQFNVNNDAIKANNDYVTAQALRELEKNGGNYLALPQDLRNAIPADDLSKVHSFARSKQEGRKESNLVIYNHLAANPDLLVGLSEDQYQKLAPELSDADFKHFATQRASLLKPTAGDSPDSLDSGSVNASLNNLLSQLNIDTTPKDADEAGKARLGTIRKFVNDSLLNAQAQSGKRFKDAELNSYISGLFAKSVTFRKTFMGFEHGTDSKQLMNATINDIDSTIKDQIRAAFAKNGIDNPTDGQILGSYFNGMSH